MAGQAAAGLEAWLGRYGSAWEARDPALAASLFAPDATYHEMPFDAPMVGRDSISAYWARVTADQRDVAFRARLIAVTGDTGIAEWAATFRSASSGATIELSGVFVLAFDGSGLCTALREWWHVRQR